MDPAACFDWRVGGFTPATRKVVLNSAAIGRNFSTPCRGRVRPRHGLRLLPAAAACGRRVHFSFCARGWGRAPAAVGLEFVREQPYE